LQTFFQHRSSVDGKSQWTNNVWFVIPYDREGLEHIWKKDEKKASDVVVAKSFMDKSIQLTVEVPNPVMSLWVNYAKEQIAFAFDSWCQEKRDDVERRFISFFGSFKQSPTPREINNAINQIGVLGIKYGDSMSASAMALYALCKQSITSKQLRDLLLDKADECEQAGSKPVTSVARAISSASIDTKYELAGILFGVDRKRGAELLIEPEIKEAFNNGEVSDFQNIVNNYKEAFQIAWDANIQLWLPKDVLNDYAFNFVKVVSSVGNWSDLIGNEQVQYFFSSLSNFIQQSMEKADFEKYDHSVLIDNLSSLLIGSLKEQTLRVISTRLNDELKVIIASMSTDVKVNEQLIVNVHKSRQRLTENGFAAQRTHYQKLDSEAWSKWVVVISKLNLDFDYVLYGKESLNAIVDNVGFNSQALDEVSLNGLYHAIKLYQGQITEEIVSKIVQWGKQPTRSTDVDYAQEVECYYKILLLLFKTTPKFRNKLLELLALSEFWGPITECEDMPSLRLLAAVALSQNEDFDPPACVLSEYWEHEIESDQIVSIIEDLVSLNALGAVWLLAREANNKLAIQIIRTDDQRLYESQCGIKYLDQYKWMQNDELRSITKKLCDGGSFSANEDDMKGNEHLDDYYEVFEIVNQYGSVDAKSFIQQQVNGITKDDWIIFLTEGKEFYTLLSSKSKHLTDALLVVLEQYIKNPHTDFPFNIERFDSLLAKVNDVQNGKFNPVAKMYFELRDTDIAADDVFEKLKPIFKQQIDNVNSQDVMYKIIGWLDNQQFDRVKWLLDSKFKPKSPVLERLQQQIEDGLSQENESSDIYRILAEFFGVSIDIENPAESEIDPTQSSS
jgi:hypothetical protein